jgi:hypothetical protein
MDCFASLAMTEKRTFAISPRVSREFYQENLALEDRGRRECRMRAAPAIS